MAAYTTTVSRILAASVPMAAGFEISVSGKGDYIKHTDGKEYSHYIQVANRAAKSLKTYVFNSRKEMCEHLIDKGGDIEKVRKETGIIL